MPTFTRVARHIQQLLDQDPANADRIRAILPPPAAEPKPTPRKRTPKTAGDSDLSAIAATAVTKAITTQAKPQL